ACKVPVVATKAGGIPEVVLNKETGFLSELKDSEMLSEYVLKILTNTYLKETIKTNAFNLVHKNHDLSVMEENYYQFYRNFKK
ncbi:MAG: hypothetical protein RL619_965, partial [Bacteroidota bacterium]